MSEMTKGLIALAIFLILGFAIGYMSCYIIENKTINVVIKNEK